MASCRKGAKPLYEPMLTLFTGAYIYIYIHIYAALGTDGLYLRPEQNGRRNAWWRHQMEPLSALLALCAGNVTGEFPSQRPVMRSFDVFFDLRLITQLSKQSRVWWFGTVTGEFPAQRPVTQSFDVFFDLRLNQQLRKQSRGWWFEAPSRSSRRHCYGSRYFRCITGNIGTLFIGIRMSLTFVPGGSIDNKQALVEITAWRWTNSAPLAELMMNTSADIFSIPLHNEVVLDGGILVSPRLSVRSSVLSSVCPYRLPRPLCNAYSSEYILSILGTNDH